MESKQFHPEGAPAAAPPPSVPGWNYSVHVLVYYEASPELGLAETCGIAYYHYNPPFDKAQWIDPAHSGRTPAFWWYLPNSAAALAEQTALQQRITYLETLIRDVRNQLPIRCSWLSPDLERQMGEAVKKK
jgi:hypothetical protein